MTADLSTQRQIEGVTVFRDDNDSSRYYLLPTEPSFRIDPQTKKPVFKFIKYKLPVDRPDGKKGGGFVVFDCEFVVPDGKLTEDPALNSEVAAAQPERLRSYDARYRPHSVHRRHGEPDPARHQRRAGQQDRQPQQAIPVRLDDLPVQPSSPPRARR